MGNFLILSWKPKMDLPKKELLTVSQAAQYLGVSSDTLRNWDNKGKLISTRTKGNSRRYKLSDLEEFIKTNLIRPYQKSSTAAVHDLVKDRHPERSPIPSAQGEMEQCLFLKTQLMYQVFPVLYLILTT